MRKIGQLLISDGVITAQALDEALQSQVAFGGRLGTNLVEIEKATVDQIAAALAKQQRLPIAPQRWVENVDKPTLRTLPLDIVRRFKVLPLSLEGQVLHVAMLDPSAPHYVADISRAAGRNVQPYVLPELRLYYWLEHHYAIKRSPRYLIERVERPPPTGSQPAARALGAGALLPGEELSDEASFEATYGTLLGAPPTPVPSLPPSVVPVVIEEPIVLEDAIEAPPRAPAAPESRPAGIVEVERRMMAARDRDEIMANTLSLALFYVRCAAFFVVHQGMVQALRGKGETLEGRELDGILLSVGVDNVVTTVASKGEPFRGHPPGTEQNAVLLHALARESVREVAVFPVRIRNRIVNVIYTDNGADEIPATAFGALSALADFTGAAYERLILERKKMST
jgi:type II secretion system (T2SS) protein E